jgi:hypothetical protein
MSEAMPNLSADKKKGYSRAGLSKGLLAVLLFFMIGNLLFLLVGKLFLYSPWAASGDITIAEDIFWINGRIPDVVFLGDSRFGEGVKPATVEQVLDDQGARLSTVNIWLASAGPDEYRMIVRNLLGHHNPRLIICDINENSLNIKSTEGNQDSRSRIWNSTPDWLKSFQDMWEWRIHTIFAAKHWGAIIQQAFYNMVSDFGRVLLLGNEPSSGNLGKSKGYFKRGDRQRPGNLAVREAIDARVYPTIQVTEEGALKLKAFLSTVQKSNLQLVMLLAPVLPELAAKFPAERYRAFLRFLEDTTAAYDIPFVNYYQAHGLPPDAFFDHHHLNNKGAELFSRKIAGEVVAPALRDWQGFKASVMAKKAGPVRNEYPTYSPPRPELGASR